MRRLFAVLTFVWLAGAGGARENAPQPGLLFHLSGDRGLTADFAAGGDPAPNYAANVRVIAGGAVGPGLECAHNQLLSYWAPGNIYAQRGTVSFFWRSREMVGPTPFPIFRVGYGDHSSWDMVWLRIDYNGRGFDAFVTDASLARTRVSFAMPTFPAPDRWTHLAFSWDENRGIRLYVDGRLVARQDGTAIFDAALDQFGPHSRIISPYQVQSAYNFVRGGDIDEIRIYDRMLGDDGVAALARGEAPTTVPPLARSLAEREWRDEWWFRNGWNRGGDAPPPLDAPSVSIRKVEIHDAWDVKRWWWKGTDGIRETTWPGVYNRSRLAGRNDYFQLPDWDCYSISGKSVTFVMPDEPWNQVEIAGAAWGTARLGPSPGEGALLFERPKGQERTFHRLTSPVRGQAVTFTNVEQETPIGEFAAYYISPGREPDGIGRLNYRLSASVQPTQPSVAAALAFINGRHPPDERATMVGVPSGAPSAALVVPARAPAAGELPVVHILIPSDFRDADAGTRRATTTYSWANMPGGLDGVALDLPALKVVPTHGVYFPLRIQVKDPIWPLRNLLDVSVSVKPGEARTVWLDLRDRILQNDKGLYLSITGAGADFGSAALEGAALRLVFKPRKDALAEHTRDRFTQVRDNYAHLVEESPRTRRLKLFARWEGDVTDLLRVDPDHVLGQQYWYDFNKEQPAPGVALDAPLAGAPRWAFRQTELLGAIKRFVGFYIDKRQVENGEFGGGLSDDGDLTNSWPGTALMGGDSETIRRSLDRHMDAFYEQGLFTNGLSTIQADELHSYEEGIQVLGQSLLLDFGSPKALERAMATAAALEGITAVNKAGHRHIRTAYFSGTTMALEGVWGWQKPSGFLAFHPAIALVDYNGAPRVRKWLLELADGLLAHYDPGKRFLQTTVEFATDAGTASADGLQSPDRAGPLLWAAYRWTGDKKYLTPLTDLGPRMLTGISANALDSLGLRDSWRAQLSAPEWTANRSDGARHVMWQVTGDVRHLETLYEDQVRAAKLREYINTEGSLWIDRVQVPMTEIQRARLGGVALVRNAYVPGHAVSWEFQGREDEQVAILVPDATPRRLTVIGYNLGPAPVQARMSTWDIEPGSWQVTVGTRRDPASGTLSNPVTATRDLERSSVMPVTFAPGTCTVVELRQVSSGIPYWRRPDLGIGRQDVRIDGRAVTVTVHSLGALAAPASRVVIRDAVGRELASAAVAAIGAPSDLKPRSTTVALRLRADAKWSGGSLSVEPAGGAKEITLVNNTVALR